MNLSKISLRQRALMSTLYRKQEKAIKDKLKNAIARGNDERYLRQVLNSIQDDMRVIDKYNRTYSESTVPKIYITAEGQTDAVIKAFDTKYDINSAVGRPSREALAVLATNTYEGLAQTVQVIGRQSDDILRRIGLEQVKGIVFGTDTWKQVAKQLEQEITANNFFYVPYKGKNGQVIKYPIKAYSEMVARTTSAEAFRLGTTNRITQRGYDLVEVVGISSDSKSPCIPYQGKTLSITGNTEGYTSLEQARSQGFNHPNCIHSLVFSDENIKLLGG